MKYLKSGIFLASMLYLMYLGLGLYWGVGKVSVEINRYFKILECRAEKNIMCATGVPMGLECYKLVGPDCAGK